MVYIFKLIYSTQTANQFGSRFSPIDWIENFVGMFVINVDRFSLYLIL